MDSTDRLGLVACLRRGLDARLRGLDAVLTGTSGLDAVAARGRGSLTQSLSHIHTCDLNEQQMNSRFLMISIHCTALLKSPWACAHGA